MAKIGRPPKYNNCLDLSAMCQLYFEYCDEGRQVSKWSAKKGDAVTFTQPRPYTVPGLAVYLGYISRRSVWDLLQKPEFSPTIKNALTRIMTQRNEGMLTGEINTIGAIFDLKNNFGWVDATQTEITEKGTTVDDILKAMAGGDPDKADEIRKALVKRLKTKGKPAASQAQLQAITRKTGT